MNDMPTADEAERSLIAQCFFDDAGLVIDNVKPDMFFSPANNLIINAITETYKPGTPADMVIVVEHLRSNGNLENVGGASGVSKLIDTSPVPGNIPHYIAKVQEAAMRREIIRRCYSLSLSARTSNLETLMPELECLSEDIDPGGDDCLVEFSDLSVSAAQQWEDIASGKALPGVMAGIENVDRFLGGFYPTDLIVVAGRPGMGKTSFAMNVAENAAKVGNRTLVYSLEMDRTQLYNRMASGISRVDSRRFRQCQFGAEEWDRLNFANEILHNLPLCIDDRGGLSVDEIARSCRRYISRYKCTDNPIKLIVIDYLQRLHVPGKKRNDLEIGDITRKLKSLAKEFHLPIIVLSQLNRAVEQRDKKRPKMSDLRESGAIEQDADLVLFLYRDEEYNEDAEPGAAELIVSKNRHGPTGFIRMRWISYRTRFV